MKRTLINLYVPAIQERYDLSIPTGMTIREVTKLLGEGISELSNERYQHSSLRMLTLKKPSVLLHPDKTLEDYGIADGSQLILF